MVQWADVKVLRPQNGGQVMEIRDIHPEQGSSALTLVIRRHSCMAPPNPVGLEQFFWQCDLNSCLEIPRA